MKRTHRPAQFSAMFNDRILKNIIAADPLMSECLQIIRAEEAREREIEKQRAAKEYARLKYTTFEFSVLYKNAGTQTCTADNFTVEGIEFAVAVFEQYRRNGHSMNLHSISVAENGSIFKRVEFTY